MIAWENKLPLTNCQSIHAFSSIFTIDFPFKLDRINYFPTIRTVIVLEKSYHVTPPLLFNWSKFFFIFFNWNISTFVPWKNFHNSNKYSKISLKKFIVIVSKRTLKIWIKYTYQYFTPRYQLAIPSHSLPTTPLLLNHRSATVSGT